MLESNAIAEDRQKVFIKTYGCQMNVYDSGRMADTLSHAGFAATEVVEEAGLIILNTCHIREKAAEKVYSELGRLRKVCNTRKAQGQDTIIAVVGCVAQAEGEEIIRRAPSVGLVLGPQNYHRLPELLSEHKKTGRPAIAADFPPQDKFASLPDAGKKHGPTAFLTIQEGCDKFCTFCVVPYTRGYEYSRPVAQIAQEAQKLVDRGVREITLLGQNVNAYHGEGPDGSTWSLARLLGHLANIQGLLRLRYTTSHPNEMTDALIDAHAHIEKLMPYLHLPLQSGSDRILKAMNRKHTASRYLEIIARLRSSRADIALSTDIITGFPGESDADFRATLELVQAVQFAQAFSFKYSPRPGTPAAAHEGQVPEEIKSERLLELQALLKVQQESFNLSKTGTVMPVLWEKRGRNPLQLIGRSPYLQAVHAEGPQELLGNITRAKIITAGPNSLAAVMETG
jgi:tRNA-2-methylthio-N6-dimethylallyladenosine synthase